jgi:hypothetical protein
VTPTSKLPAGPGWLARHKVEVLATGAALAVTAAGVKTREAVLEWSGDHPKAAVGTGMALGGATGVVLAALSGVAVEPVVIRAMDGAVDVVGKAAEAAKGVIQDSRPLTLAGGTLAGAAVGALIGQFLVRQAARKQAEQTGDPLVAEPETQVPAGWLARLRFWAAYRTDQNQAEPQAGQAV